MKYATHVMKQLCVDEGAAVQVVLGAGHQTVCPVCDVSMDRTAACCDEAVGCVQNVSVATMLAKIESVCGPLSAEFVASGRNSHLYYTRSRQLYERDAGTGTLTVLQPTRSSVAAQLPAAAGADSAFVDFLEQLLQTDPAMRPSAEAALGHPWLRGSTALAVDQ